MNRDSGVDTLELTKVHSLPRKDFPSGQQQRADRLAFPSLRGTDDVTTFFENMTDKIQIPAYPQPS